MSFPIDYKIDKVIKQIQEEIKSEYGVELDYQTVVQIIEAQYKATIRGMEEGQTIVWKYLGTFVATKSRIKNLNKRYEKRGKTPTLIDNGFHRISFKKNGEQIAEVVFEGQSKRDYYDGQKDATTSEEPTVN